MNHIEKEVREQLRRQFEDDLKKKYREKLYKEVQAEVYAKYGEDNPQSKVEKHLENLKDFNKNYWKKGYWIKDIFGIKS
jgi:FKBP-type peptidyl-prolyl cis-trans isomerase (trigger factor)